MHKVVGRILLPIVALAALSFSMFGQVVGQVSGSGKTPSGFGVAAPSKVGGGRGVVHNSIPPIEGVKSAAPGEYTINSPRPLDAAAELLERKLGVPVSYEDAAWAAPDTVMAADLPENQSLSANHPGWRGNIVPRDGTLSVTLPTQLGALQAANPATLIQAVIDNNLSQHNAGQFKLVQFGSNEFSIVAELAADSSGQMVAQSSPLDIPISFPTQERSLKDTLNLILNPIHVTLTNGFRNPNLPRVTLGASSELARNVLSAALRQPGQAKVSWHMAYLPDSKVYVLTLTSLNIEVADPRGNGTKLMPAFWPNK